MAMTAPLPAEGSTAWYAWASEVHNDLNGISAFGATLIDDANDTAARATLGLGTLATVNDAPSDGTNYARNNGAWTQLADPDPIALILALGG